MKKIKCLISVLCILALFAACGNDNQPPDGASPPPPAHNGVFVSQYGTMSFNGDGESVSVDFTGELAEVLGLSEGEHDGSYAFLFGHGLWRYDKAERFELYIGDEIFICLNDFGATDEDTITILPPEWDGDSIVFEKGAQQ